jgi:hypothetical protein
MFTIVSQCSLDALARPRLFTRFETNMLGEHALERSTLYSKVGQKHCNFPTLPYRSVGRCPFRMKLDISQRLQAIHLLYEVLDALFTQSYEGLLTTPSFTAIQDGLQVISLNQLYNL